MPSILRHTFSAGIFISWNNSSARLLCCVVSSSDTASSFFGLVADQDISNNGKSQELASNSAKLVRRSIPLTNIAFTQSVGPLEALEAAILQMIRYVFSKKKGKSTQVCDN